MIDIQGARTHNLKNISLTLPRDKLIVITGLSGSGKSSLAFDTLYAEGQRRYVESLSAYARQFLSMMAKPEVDHIAGLSPAIAIEQKSTSHNPRSTVGTVTEIYDYLRVLYARVGEPRCPDHAMTLQAQTITQMVDTTLGLPPDSKIMLLAPIIQERKGEHLQVLEKLKSQGYLRVRINGQLMELKDITALNMHKKHTIEVVVDRLLKIHKDQQQRLAESFATALQLSDGLAKLAILDEQHQVKQILLFSARFACTQCGYSLPELEPRLFSFNNPNGACPTCDGLGVQQLLAVERVVRPQESLARGAICGWDKSNLYCYAILQSLAKHYSFDLTTPFQELPKAIQQILLSGSGQEKIEFSYNNFSKIHAFEGIIPNLERRFRNSESLATREELARFFMHKPCTACLGSRLRLEARHVYVNDLNLLQLTHLSISEVQQFFAHLTLPGRRGEIAQCLQKEIYDRLSFLINVGLDYLTLGRTADTLSGGEAQRIRLASQIGSGLTGVMYVLDEPSIGLHQRDNQRLLNTLLRLRDLGNTVIVVEHDTEAILSADYVVDMGPGAGSHGGHVVAQGTPTEIMQHPTSLTGQYLAGTLAIHVPKQRVPYDETRVLKLYGAEGNNLHKIDVAIPVGLFTCITGISGSGKSTLINDTLYPIVAHYLHGISHVTPAPYQAIEGLEHFDKVINIDQSPIGRTPRSNPATYTSLFTPIRELFAATQEARSRGYLTGRFSFNVKGGRCEACEGDGVIRVAMHFLADVYVECDVCKGQRYNRETLDIRFKGKTIDEVLNMTVEEAYTFFASIPVVAHKLHTLIEVGLSYIKLGQNATTLSGGEAQRIKLARELAKRATGRTLYILDEPTTGLHFADIRQLLSVLQQLRNHGNTLVVIEHNLDVIKTADWIIDLGPEGGTKGGQLVCVGTPERVANTPQSYTGQFLQKFLNK